jgi:hypothetical protein
MLAMRAGNQSVAVAILLKFQAFDIPDCLYVQPNVAFRIIKPNQFVSAAGFSSIDPRNVSEMVLELLDSPM